MTDPDLIGYLLGALDPAEDAAVAEHVQGSAKARADLEQLRTRLRFLEADRDVKPAPVGLTDRTMARFAELLSTIDTPADPLGIRRTVVDPPPSAAAESEPARTTTTPRAPREAPETRTVGGRFRPDLLVACAIAVLVGGLVLTGVSKLRARSNLLACQANLRTLYAGLVGYADTHDGRYPQVGPGETAESFATTLAAAGQVPADFRPGCPAAPDVIPASYTFTLGFHTSTGEVVGLRRADGLAEEHDLLAVSADFPTASAAPTDGPLCPHPPLMNVLFLGGNVRTTTTPLIGPNGDDIYRNLNGQVAAGVDRMDVVLGRPGDRP